MCSNAGEIWVTGSNTHGLKYSIESGEEKSETLEKIKEELKPIHKILIYPPKMDITMRENKHIRFKSISCGNNHIMATTKDGFVYAWGSNSDGQLGLGKISNCERTPTQVKSLFTGV